MEEVMNGVSRCMDCGYHIEKAAMRIWTDGYGDRHALCPRCWRDRNDDTAENAALKAEIEKLKGEK